MTLPTPYHSPLVDLLVPHQESAVLAAHAVTLPSIQISARVQRDLELLATGAFSPLEGFMNQRDYERLLAEMRLADGTLWPLPITLPVDGEAPVETGREIALRSSKNELLAILAVEEIYSWDRAEAASAIAGTTDRKHPLVEIDSSRSSSTRRSQCAQSRDVKGMYTQARSGALKGFTGIDDPYEAPQAAEIVLDTTRVTAEENSNRIMTFLRQRGLVRPDAWNLNRFTN